MRKKGVLRKKPAGWRTIDRKHDTMVFRIGRPLAAFSMIALHKCHISLSQFFSFLAGMIADLPVNNSNDRTCQSPSRSSTNDIHTQPSA